ncbi:glycosyl hydrolase family 8 [Paenibacillus sp. Soil787]|uniref:glycosyl hydrolase family 8 n=1 Tax=Paenibacillus sp. Soil787 TaxID=1736411 RepID=UPI001F265EDC|nr:glycosyl hydrolase family 8 [Paenibacillus sp. Soil787]
MKISTSATEKFIQQYMINPNGTFATYLMDDVSVNADTVAGREALSESMGLWMQYAVLKQDQSMFESSYRLLKSHFISPQNYIIWKLSPNGQVSVTTNALGDDFRIIDSLLNASILWNDDEYQELAKEISDTLVTSVQMNGYFVDFHDFLRDESPSTLSLPYVDISALKKMNQKGIIDNSTYVKYSDLLLKMPDDGVFFPKVFDVNTKQYVFDESVNIIDQLIVGIHCAELGRKSEGLISFLKTEFEHQGKLMGRFTRANRKADVTYESPSIYGLAILLAIKSDDHDWAKKLYKRMISLRDQDKSYIGGYVFDKNTHIFDNLFPLLAETAIK